MSRPFEARHHSGCAADCGDRIRPGDEVVYVADELVHAECAPTSSAAVERPEPAACPSCWTVHRGECL